MMRESEGERGSVTSKQPDKNWMFGCGDREEGERDASTLHTHLGLDGEKSG
jgi:hypothetical protein